MAQGRGQRWLTAAAAVVLPLAAWELANRTILNSTLIPPPSVVAGTAWAMVRTGELFVHVAISLRRILVGFALGSALGIALGLAAAGSVVVRDLLRPLLGVCSSVPPIALIPLAMVWFGIDEGARLFMIIYLAAELMVPATLTGAANI